MSSFKARARTLFAPLLNPLENGDADYQYIPKSRAILVIMSVLFLGLSSGLALFLPEGVDPAFVLPVAVFGLIGLFGMLVAWLGSDRAVARLWSRKQS